MKFPPQGMKKGNASKSVQGRCRDTESFNDARISLIIGLIIISPFLSSMLDESNFDSNVLTGAFSLQLLYN